MAAPFVDTARITVKSGNGGNGVVAFHREKYVNAGGPDGGDGGKGGNIVLEIDDHMSTLMDFRFKRKYTAKNGEDGGGKRCTGKDGEDLVIRIPRGTVIRDTASGEIIQDMSGETRYILAAGGKGGWGNQHFATPTRQAPRFAKQGYPGKTREVTLELKLLADVGLIGFPNVGKSTFLSVVSRARPKIANYHFTTLFPNLGVVFVENGESFVLADIPGIIEGAAEGAGLGYDFLRHIDRCRLLIHVVDVSGSEGRNPLEDFKAICSELEQYSPELATRKMLVVGNKSDMMEGDEAQEDLKELQDYVVTLGYDFFLCSAAAQQGTAPVVQKVVEELSKLPPVIHYEATFVEKPPEVDTSEELSVIQDEETWIIEGPWLQRLIAHVNFSDYESRNWFEKNLKDSGLYTRLEAMGIQDGDIVSMYDLEFEYQR